MKKLLLILLGMLLLCTACNKNNGGPVLPLQPRLRPGGSAINGGNNMPIQCGGFLEPECQDDRQHCDSNGCF